MLHTERDTHTHTHISFSSATDSFYVVISMNSKYMAATAAATGSRSVTHAAGDRQNIWAEPRRRLHVEEPPPRGMPPHNSLNKNALPPVTTTTITTRLLHEKPMQLLLLLTLKTFPQDEASFPCMEMSWRTIIPNITKNLLRHLWYCLQLIPAEFGC